MMKLKLFLIATLALFGSMAFASSESETQAPKKVLRHIVLFKFKDKATAAQIKEVETAFRKLPSQIKEIKGFEWGKNNSPEGLDQGLTHAFFLTFDSEADRAIYLPHPAHKAFGKILGPYLDKAVVVDYWAEK
jgi:hypothetical protein